MPYLRPVRFVSLAPALVCVVVVAGQEKPSAPAKPAVIVSR